MFIRWRCNWQPLPYRKKIVEPFYLEELKAGSNSSAHFFFLRGLLLKEGYLCDRPFIPKQADGITIETQHDQIKSGCISNRPAGEMFLS
ncbi:hypothetical protein NPIL_313831 [Nephila pilipes]|uniref:Uncharacterized protein n=1 Tax=Nephila pilipes TaxID=299642 RepID=A0A8X6TX14_NEPPI|nr:hypothetical protein NPIL_313831 [Nephila pilipes]